MAGAVDACTLAPDTIAGTIITACCQAHDAAYVTARTIFEKLTADAALGQCIASHDGWQLDAAGVVYFLATATIGTVFWLRARWRRTPTTASPQPASSGLFHAPQEAPMNRKAFYDAVRAHVGVLNQGQVGGFERYLDEGERRGTQLDWLAYIIATVFWETARTMLPVKEAYWKSEAWRKANLRYFPWYGRGDIQLTWEPNYRKAGAAIGVDLIKDPDAALDPANAVKIAFEGMEHGWFTGKDLGDYLDGVDESEAEDLREFANARRIVNGVDKQIEIGKLALAFEGALRAAAYAGVSNAVSDPVIAAQTAQEAPMPDAKPPTAPAAPLPANASPTPVEQSSKSLGAGKWTGIVGTTWTTISAFLMSTPSVPEQYRDPILLAAIGTLLTTLASIIGAYVAPQNAVPAAGS